MFQEFHGLQMRVKLVDDSQLFTEQVFDDIAHGHVVG